MVPPLITLEEHFITDEIWELDKRYSAFPPHLSKALLDLDNERLQHMDAGGVKLQVISHAPSRRSTENCRNANDRLATACKAHPSRYAGFATLDMSRPMEAADELERCVNDLGFVGALIDNNLEDGTFYDADKFWVVFERAVQLDVPIYIHPAFPSEAMTEHYKGNYSDKTAFLLSISSWGWHADVGLHVLKLFAAGLFDKLPMLKLVIGHMGEMIPFMFGRIMQQTAMWEPRQRDFSVVWRDNIWVTTAGFFTVPSLQCLMAISPPDKIMYSVDYPFAANERGLEFIKELEDGVVMPSEQLHAFCHGNAEKLLKVKLRS